MPPKSYELIHLVPEQLHFSRTGDTLSLQMTDGTRYSRVALRSCFPVAKGSHYLSVRDANTEDQDEIGIIDDWFALQEDDRKAVAAELGLYYFVPLIQRVEAVKEEFGFLYWTVGTSRGTRQFVMRNSIVHYAREVAPGRWLLIDVNQARWEIPNLDTLDSQSQKLVRRFLYL